MVSTLGWQTGGRQFRYFHIVWRGSALLSAVYLGHIPTSNICHSGRGIQPDVSIPDCRKTLQIHQATFLIDCAMLATAVASQNMMLAPGHWSIRPQLAQIAASTAFDASKIYHINRGYNFRAHHQAKLALKIQDSSFSYRCLHSGIYTCLNAHVATISCIMQCNIVHVRCC